MAEVKRFNAPNERYVMKEGDIGREGAHGIERGVMRKSLTTLRSISGALGSIAAAIISIAIPSTSFAVENFSLDTISVAYTNQAEQDSVNGRGTEDEKKTVIQYEHFGLNEWGFLYADIEASLGKGVGSIPQFGDKGDSLDYFGVVTPGVSLSKVTGHSFTRGPLSDLAVVGLVRASSYYNYRSWGVGVSASFDVPGFMWFETSLLTHDSDWAVEPTTFDSGTGKNYKLDSNQWLWRTYLISKPILIADERFHLNSFTTVNGTENNGTAVFQRLDLTWEILGHSDFQAGIRYEYVSHENDPSVSFGSNSYSSHTPSLVFKYVL